MSLGYVDLPIQGEDLDARPVPKCYLAMWKKSGKKNLFPRTLTAGLSGSVWLVVYSTFLFMPGPGEILFGSWLSWMRQGFLLTAWEHYCGV